MVTSNERSAGGCVVCSGPVTTPVWPNAWERAEGRRPCCSENCRSAFHPDRHWMPSEKPAELGEEAVDTMIYAAKARMKQGDEASPVARDLLIAGVPPWMVRNAVVDAGGRARRAQALGAASLWMTFGGWIAGSTRERHDPSKGRDALEDVAQWIARFGER